MITKLEHHPVNMSRFNNIYDQHSIEILITIYGIRNSLAAFTFSKNMCRFYEYYRRHYYDVTLNEIPARNGVTVAVSGMPLSRDYGHDYMKRPHQERPA